MAPIEQGDLLKIEGIKYPVIVVSNNYFNRSGMVIACPIVKTAVPGPLHIPLKDSAAQSIVLCEQVRYLDLSSRRWSKLTQTHCFDIMDISDAVVSMFEYQ